MKRDHESLLGQQEFSFFSLSRVDRYAAHQWRMERSKLSLSKSYFFRTESRLTFRGQEDGPCILGNYLLMIKILASFVFAQDHALGAADTVHLVFLGISESLNWSAFFFCSY